jgi:hypothetical protein
MRNASRSVAALALLVASASGAGDTLPTSQSLTTRAIRFKEIRLGDGSVMPAGDYALKISGVGRADEVAITLFDLKGREMGAFKGRLRRSTPGGARTWGDPHAPETLAGLGFSAESEVRLVTRGSLTTLRISGTGAVIEAELTPAPR